MMYDTYPHDSVDSHKWCDQEALGLLHQVRVRVNVSSLVHPGQGKYILKFTTFNH